MKRPATEIKEIIEGVKALAATRPQYRLVDLDGHILTCTFPGDAYEVRFVGQYADGEDLYGAVALTPTKTSAAFLDDVRAMLGCMDEAAQRPSPPAS